MYLNVNDLYDNQLKAFKVIFPRINIPNDLKDNFIKRFSKYSGTSYQIIEWLPGVMDNDSRLLRVIDELTDYIFNNYYDDDLSSITSVFPKMPFRKKDILRLSNIVSSDMVPTIANPTLLKKSYDKEFLKFFSDCLDKIGAHLEWLPDCNCYIRKRKGSSNGSFTGDNSEKLTALIFDEIKYNIINLGWSYFYNILAIDVKVATKPTTRRMVKAPKIIKDFTISGKLEEIDRHLTRKNDIEISNSLKYPLYGPKHRFVSNTFEGERVTSIFQMPFYSRISKEFNYSLIPNFDEIRIQLSTNQDVCCTDASAFDKHINEEIMELLETFISKFYGDEGKKLNFNFNFRKLKEAYFPSDKPDHVIGMTALYNELFNTNEATMLGLDSGHWLVSLFGKLSMSINILFILSKIIDVSSNDIISFLKGQLSVMDNGKLTKLVNFNSSDDNMLISSRSIIEKFTKFLINNKSIDDLDTLPFIPIDIDGEYLSMVVIEKQSEGLTLQDNLMRRIASLLKPEYSIREYDGLYKNYLVSFKDKLETIMRYSEGVDIIKFLESRLLSYGVINKPTIIEHLEDIKNNFPIRIADNLPDHILAELNDEEKLVLANNEYFYYKVDQDKIRDEIKEYLFYHVKPEYFQEIFKKLNVQFVLVD